MIMLELILVACIVLYLALSVWAVVLAGKWAKKRGRRRWPWCTTVGLFMYLLVAWEQIPTFVVGRYYCATQAGLTVYKTPEQWVAENPGVEEVLTWRNISPEKNHGIRGADIFLNQRLVWSVRNNALKYLPVNISVDEVFDREKETVLVRHVAISTGYDKWYGYKGWKKLRFLVGGVRCANDYPNFFKLKNSFKHLGKEISQ
jgi:hypothetical protein